MASTSIPKMDKIWLDKNTVRVTKAGWHYLKDKRIAILKNNKVKIIGRWDGKELTQ